MPDYAAIHDLMISLAREAGDTAVEQFRLGVDSLPKGDGIDVVTAVDVTCEQRMIDRIRAVYPDHGITGEEHGIVCHPHAPLQWLLDPLDGTNNYVLGMPMFGTCLTVLEQGQPIVSAVHDSVGRITTSAYRGGGARRNGIATQVGVFPDFARTTISWTQGYAIASDDAWVRDTVYALELRFKRVLHTWSPSIDWGLIAAGKVGAFVAWKNQIHDLVCGELIVTEAGGEVWRDETGDLVIAGAAEVVAEIRRQMSLVSARP